MGHLTWTEGTCSLTGRMSSHQKKKKKTCYALYWCFVAHHMAHHEPHRQKDGTDEQPELAHHYGWQVGISLHWCFNKLHSQNLENPWKKLSITPPSGTFFYYNTAHTTSYNLIDPGFVHGGLRKWTPVQPTLPYALTTQSTAKRSVQQEKGMTEPR